MLDELRKNYTEDDICMAFDEWLDEADNFEPTAKNVAIILAVFVAPVVVAAGIVGAIGAVHNKRAEYKAKKKKENN